MPQTTQRLSHQQPLLFIAPVLLLIALALLLAAPLVVLVPPGEAPDEPAHIAYVQYTLRHGTLPPVVGEPRAGDPRLIYSYEFYQPPLAYLVMVGGVRTAGFDSLEYPFTPNPDFVFQRNTRAFLNPPPPPKAATVEALWAISVARSVNLWWLIVTVVAIFFTCFQLTRSPWVAMTAAAPFALSPQLLFASAIVGNDAALTALAATATAGLVALFTASRGLGAAVIASTAAGLALWTKASAVVIAPAIGLGLWWLTRARRWREGVALLVPGLLLAAGWIVFEIRRTGTIIPSPPTGWAGGSGWGRLMMEPVWVAKAWTSFWAKLGWLNVVLPLPAYLLFVLPTAAVVAGLFVVWRPEARRKAGGLLLAVVAANAALLVVYMARIDWQPQGRYLLPAIAALAGLAAAGVERTAAALPAGGEKVLAAVSGTLAVAGALTALAVVAAVYG